MYCNVIVIGMGRRCAAGRAAVRAVAGRERGGVAPGDARGDAAFRVGAVRAHDGAT